MALGYNDLTLGQKVKVQVFYGELTDLTYTGDITYKDGQNIVVEVENRNYTANDTEIKLRDFEACNPSFAVVVQA